jgi:hypothetical protein
MADKQRRAGINYPTPKAAYSPDADLKQRVEQMLVQFYELYDGQPSEKSRQMLVHAYEEEVSPFFHVHINGLSFRQSLRIRFKCYPSAEELLSMSKSEFFY